MGQNLALSIAEKGFPISKPRVIIMLVKAGPPVDQTIKTSSIYLEKRDCITDGDNEWYENSERRGKAMAELGLLSLGMGISEGGSGNFVKMVHNGTEYGDMQLIAEAYDLLKSVWKLSNERPIK
ncbi:6-phosphogluconate dehydrogenase, decarboxylating 3-like [Durio zibethinus]|uniref:phosphogluconate dehydrogenase (NADP(+)-dependent, decarboxylating) n=1 Tax=Durio zibethinus TaxID=66656 RepID=A0A6P5Y5F9_DURZI|nr:6-phosphogluconate dehydrogenase, decarboxylating 3-like [Durio zibethinus]